MLYCKVPLMAVPANLPLQSVPPTHFTTVYSFCFIRISSKEYPFNIVYCLISTLLIVHSAALCTDKNLIFLNFLIFNDPIYSTYGRTVGQSVG